MKCPKCGIEMEEGYLKSGDSLGITWVKKVLPLGLDYFKLDTVNISDIGTFGEQIAKASICKSCKIFVGDYNE